MVKDKGKRSFKDELLENIAIILLIIGFVAAFAMIPYIAIKYHAKGIQTEKQYLSDGYHIADITIDGYTNRSYAIDDEQLDAYISGKEKISVKDISSGDTEIIKTSTISSFSVKNEDHIKRKGEKDYET